MTLVDIKRTAYNWTEPREMTRDERRLWTGLGFCYEWCRNHPKAKGECDKLAQIYINNLSKDNP